MTRTSLFAVCNALVDVLYEVPESIVHELSLTKGIMHLVDSQRQAEVLQHLKGRQGTTELGGSAMNVVRTVAALGMRTGFAGLIGKDDFGRRISERMKQLNIEAHLGESASEPTGSCLILITPDGERTMNTHLGASRLYTKNDIPTAAVANSAIFHFCGYQWDTEGQKAGIQLALQAASRSSETLVSFDLADPFVVERYRDEFTSIIREHADIVFTNKEEARLMFHATPEEAARHIAETGAIAVVKVGAEGAIVQKGATVHRIPPFSTKVIDTTAAGDMFAAGFLYGYLKAKDLPTAGRMGAFMASDVISRVGATVSEAALAKLPDI